MQLLVDHLRSELGDLTLVAEGESLCALDFEDDAGEVEARLRKRYPQAQLEPAADPGGLTSRIAAYLAGDLGAIEPIAVSTGGTEFQRRVWRALRAIPPGTTLSYGALPRRLGQPSACRAVGLANGRNPVAIVVPCHRVIGADGTLTGYGGGLHRKRWLLAHERALLPDASTQLPLHL